MHVHRPTLAVAFACCLLPSCSVRVIAHDEHAAAKAAEKLADSAFAKSEYDGVHELFSPDMQRLLPGAKEVTEAVVKMHPKGRPSGVKAIEFEPIPGQRAMLIYLKGTRDDEEFFYRFRMVGDKGAGYKVDFMGRGSGPYPTSARRPL